VAGAGVDDPAAVLRLAEGFGWPVLADPRSGCRRPHPHVVAHADALLRSQSVADRLRPELVLRLGEPPASKVVGQWLVASGAELVVLSADGAVLDPDRQAATILPVPVSALADAVLGGAVLGGAVLAPDRESAEVADPVGWVAGWRAADDAAAGALERWLGGTAEATEIGTARGLALATGDADTLVVSSSMPVRDVEWYAPARQGLRVLANRGANGIDGVVSTATGVALRSGVTWLLIGDLALLHDGGGLLGLAHRSLRLRIVVVDNDGGGIFSFLPQSAALPVERFERFYGTPQPVDVVRLLAVHGIEAQVACTGREVEDGLRRLARSAATVAALVVRSDRSRNVEDHDAVHAAMTAAAEAALDR
jgi:2-succinyl-5-enolpyruvyl-6-hydroxy-3-cyclohexene-1-carboxylate synthase